jgi:3-phosphoshikimate 1-carboxyvinyltransferase
LEYVHINPAKLNGKINVPSSKSICHRAIICASLGDGVSNLENISFSRDIYATCNAVENLGVKIYRGKSNLTVKGNPRLTVKNPYINCGQSGSTLRFLVPIAAAIDEKIIFTGGGKLIDRPLDVYYDIFDNQKIYYKNFNGKLPLILKGKLKPGDYEVRGDISSQFITGLLFVLPILDGDSSVNLTTALESRPYVDITLDVLKKFGIKVCEDGLKRYVVRGRQKYESSDYRVEGDFSQAAFWLVMGALGNGIVCCGLKKDSLQGDRMIVDILKKMGIKVKWTGNSLIAMPSDRIYGSTIDASQCPDLVPVLAALASVSCGTTEIKNAGRLRIKESDRLKAISSELNKIGGHVLEKEDGLLIRGRERLAGGEVDSWDDHRIAMSLASVSSRCLNPMTIKGAECVKKSYPGFWKDFMILGGNIL